MRLGMYIDMRNPPHKQRPWSAHYGRWLERIEEAERLGADVVWLTEHHFFDDGYLPQCWTVASAIAARTQRIRIGSAVTLLPLHKTLELAEQIALVDVISGGRVEPGFGVGYRKPEYLYFEGDFKRRYRVFADRISEIRRWWGELPGARHKVTPAPLQSPMPMWGGFAGPMGARMAGRLGLGLLTLEHSLLHDYTDGLSAGGHSLSTARMGGQVEFFITEDPERTWAEIGNHVAYRWRSYNRYLFEGTSREGNRSRHIDMAEIRERFLLGTPAQLAAAIRARVAGLPVTDLFVWSDYPGISDELIDQHIQRTFTELAPLLRAP